MRPKGLVTADLDYDVVTIFRDFQPQLDPSCSVAVLSQVPHHIPSLISFQVLTQSYSSLKMLGSLMLLFARSGSASALHWEDGLHHARSIHCLSWYLQAYLLPETFPPPLLSQGRRKSSFWSILWIGKDCLPFDPILNWSPVNLVLPVIHFMALSSIATSITLILSLQYIKMTSPTFPQSYSLVSFLPLTVNFLQKWTLVSSVFTQNPFTPLSTECPLLPAHCTCSC